MKSLLILALAGLFLAGLSGCRAEGEIDVHSSPVDIR